jgi:hypothetical protein
MIADELELRRDEERAGPIELQELLFFDLIQMLTFISGGERGIRTLDRAFDPILP